MSKARAGMSAVFVAGLLAASCGGGGGYGGGSTTPTASSTAGAATTSSSNAAPDVLITIKGMSFSPSNAAVQSGQTVAWKNADSLAHTATQDDSGFDTGTIAPGATSSPITITSSALVRYHCRFHPGMVGTLNGTNDGGSGY